MLFRSVRLFRTVWDFIGTPFGSRMTLYERYFNGDLVRLRQGRFATYDYTDPSISIAARPSTVIAPQALWMLNSPFVLEQAKAWSARLHAAVPAQQAPAQATLANRTSDPAAERVALAYRQAFGRLPTERERAAGLAFLAAEGARGPDDAWAAYAQVLLASSEFITLE